MWTEDEKQKATKLDFDAPKLSRESRAAARIIFWRKSVEYILNA